MLQDARAGGHAGLDAGNRPRHDKKPSAGKVGSDQTLAALLYAQHLPGEIGAALATAATDSFTTPWTDGIAALTLLAVSIFAGSMLRGVSAQADIAGADRVGRIHARPKPSLPAGLIEAEVGEFGAG